MPKVPQAHLDARRNQILEAAMACFSRQGFHRTTMQDIYAESGLSPGAVYRYFTSKDALIEAIVDAAHGLAEHVTAVAAAGASDLEALMDALLEGFDAWPLAAVDQRQRVAVEIWAEALRNPRVNERGRRNLDLALRTLTRAAEAEQRAGRLAPDLVPEAVARTLVALFSGLLLQRTLFGELDVAAYRAAVRALLRGLRPPAQVS